MIVVASSGIASTLLINGHTAHPMFKIPIEINEQSVCNVDKRSDLSKYLKSSEIWDEIIMMSKMVVESVDRLLKDVCNSDKLFGEKLVIFSGDLRQILPIVHGGKAEVLNMCMMNSYICLRFGTIAVRFFY